MTNQGSRKMRSLKKLGISAVIVLAFNASAAATSSAAEFTYAGSSNLSGHALNTQEFTFSGGTVKCKTASSSGIFAQFASEEMHLTVEYRECQAFFGAFTLAAEVSWATYGFTANGSVDIQSQIGFNIPALGCKLTISSPQTVGTVVYDSGLVETNNLSGINYTSSGGFCGSSGTTGTFKGNDEVGPINFDP